MIQSATVSVNRYIDNLKHQLDQAELEGLEYLVLAHADDRMIRRLQYALVDRSVAVIGIPQSCWAMDEESVEELMDWVLNELGVKKVLLVGHSQGGLPTDQVKVCGTENGSSIRTTDPANRLSSLFDCIDQAQSAVKRTEEHLWAQLELLQNQSVVQAHQSQNKNLIQGLFYRGESDVFCLCDPETKQFHALIVEG